MLWEDDYTYCSKEHCKHINCFRHLNNLKGKRYLISIAMFENTEWCPITKATDKLNSPLKDAELL